MSIGPWNTEEENFEDQFDHSNDDAKHPTIIQVMAREAMKALTSKQREIWQFRHMDGFTQDEIAIKLGISQPVVSKHLLAAENRMNKWAKKYESMYDTLKQETNIVEDIDRANGMREYNDLKHKTPIRRSDYDGKE